MQRKNNISKKKKLLIIVIASIAVIMGGMLLWMNQSYDYDAIAVMASVGDSEVRVTEDEYIVFEPADGQATKGFIFYPGAKVEPKAYSTLCRAIAEEGYKVIIVPMPMNFAIFGGDKANDVIEAYPEIEIWAIGGHSLGGVMACSYAATDDKIKGVVLYASYPSGDELAHSDVKVLSIWGSLDGVADIEKIKSANLPEESKFVEIHGGNHGQFGNYGEQAGDNEATITRETQINKAASLTAGFLSEL